MKLKRILYTAAIIVTAMAFAAAPALAETVSRDGFDVCFTRDKQEYADGRCSQALGRVKIKR